MVSVVSWFRFIGFVVSRFYGFICFVVSTVTRFPRFCGVNGFIVSCVSWFHRFRGVNGFMVS